MTAMSFLVLGEFRRYVRGAVLGPTATGTPAHDNFIIRGFAVEPAAVPDATIRVRLDPGGTSPLGFAIGAELLGTPGVGPFDFGQLIGGDDSAGSLEGNATQTLDFSAQAFPAVYRVQMRFTYSDGAADNRAFWDQGTNTEFIASTDTRHLPVFELRLSGAASDEWIDLADVTWDGGTIDPPDIADLRDFAFEGASPFDGATQAAAGAFADFDRSATRAADGLNEVYPILRALGRQVQDIKGEDDAGSFNWYGRVYKPADPDAGLAVTKTSSLRTVRTASYTIGDGTTTFGDFNGANGLEDCLQLLETQSTNDTGADHIRIILKSNTVGGFTWNVNTKHSIGRSIPIERTVTLEIIGRCDGGSTANGSANINFDSVPAGSAAAIDVVGKLILRDVGNDDVGEPATNTTLFAADVIVAERCRFYGRTSDAAGASEDVLRVTNGLAIGGNVFGHSRIVDCEWRGRIAIVDPSIAAATVDNVPGGVIENCWTENGAIQFDTSAAAQAPTRQWEIRNCYIQMDESHTGTPFGQRGAIDCGDASVMRIVNCTLVYTSDVDGIHFREVNNLPFKVLVEGCRFVPNGAPTVGTHGVGTGQNGAVGTGWGVYLEAATSAVIDIHVRDCVFSGETIDSGGVYIEGSSLNGIHIADNTWRICSSTSAATSSYTAIELDGTSTLTGGVHIAGNHIGEWGGTVVTRTAGIRLTNTAGVTIEGNTIDGADSGGSAITSRGVANVALELNTTNLDLRVVGNLFRNWEENTDISRCISNQGGASLLRPVLASNSFEDNGGFAAVLGACVQPIIDGNNVQVSGTAGRAFSTLSATRSLINNNNIAMGGVARTGIDFGAAGTSGGMAMGNRMNIGTINITSGNVWGVNLTMTKGNYLT
jgi:hypothetical protein